jgi:hypothetical protein
MLKGICDVEPELVCLKASGLLVGFLLACWLMHAILHGGTSFKAVTGRQVSNHLTIQANPFTHYM